PRHPTLHSIRLLVDATTGGRFCPRPSRPDAFPSRRRVAPITKRETFPRRRDEPIRRIEEDDVCSATHAAPPAPSPDLPRPRFGSHQPFVLPESPGAKQREHQP